MFIATVAVDLKISVSGRDCAGAGSKAGNRTPYAGVGTYNHNMFTGSNYSH